MTMEEGERMGALQQARLAAEAARNPAGAAVNPKAALSFWKKISQHWLILVTAVFFDIIGLIPFVDVVVNFIFGLILYLYFGSKPKTGGSELLKIGLPIGIGSALDSIFSFLPVNIAAALIRIFLS